MGSPPDKFSKGLISKYSKENMKKSFDFGNEK